MKMKNILLSALALTFALTSCNEWLDVMPDNRAEVDTAEKVEKLLVSAYPENAYIVMSELSSDNVDDYGDTPYQERIYAQLYQWADVTETDNEDPKSVWGALYGAITNANILTFFASIIFSYDNPTIVPSDKISIFSVILHLDQ